MISAQDAQSIVLQRVDDAADEDDLDRIVIQSCELSERGDYWVIRANSKAYVIYGMQERCYVGVNAYLVSTTTGTLDIVGSGQSLESYLQDRYDLAAAGDNHYVLGPAFGRSDKAALLHLHQQLECRLQDAIRLLSAPQNAWITGQLSTLQMASKILQQRGIEVCIVLCPEVGSAIKIESNVWHWEALKAEFHRLIHSLTHLPART